MREKPKRTGQTSCLFPVMLASALLFASCVEKKDPPLPPDVTEDYQDAADLASDVCVPDCEGKECGADGCGSVCGSCEALEQCLELPGLCECLHLSCGEGCCEEGQGCSDGDCCNPGCQDDWECGPDACGAACGECGENEECAEHVCECLASASSCGNSCCDKDNQVCVEAEGGKTCCQPDCTDKPEGDDGCGGCCGGCCPDGICQPQKGESCNTCIKDCGLCCKCGDGMCVFAPDCYEPQLCPTDNCPSCGNMDCQGGEGPETCPLDCCGKCGDGICANYSGCNESKDQCPDDCGETFTCGNDSCDEGENPDNCPEDCGKFACGNRVCEPGEDPEECKIDCSVSCGNCSCDPGEDFISCPFDCPVCGDGYCSLCPYMNESVVCAKDCE